MSTGSFPGSYISTKVNKISLKMRTLLAAHPSPVFWPVLPHSSAYLCARAGVPPFLELLGATSTGQPCAPSCLGSRDGPTRHPRFSERMPWDAPRALPGGWPRPILPSPALMVGHAAGLLPVRVWGWVAGGQVGGPAVCTPGPGPVSAASALKARRSFRPELSPRGIHLAQALLQCSLPACPRRCSILSPLRVQTRNPV